MLYAYGATIVEIVRRKEFCESLTSVVITDFLIEPIARFFFQRAQSILEVMAKLS